MCFLTFSCKTDGRKSFSITIEYTSYWTYPTKYILTQNSIIVNGTENRSGSKIKDVYKRLLTKSESEYIYSFLKSIPYETLNDTYVNKSFFDGITSIFKISGQELKSKKVLVYMSGTPVTDTLEKLMDRQVFEDRYKWRNYYDYE